MNSDWELVGDQDDPPFQHFKEVSETEVIDALKDLSYTGRDYGGNPNKTRMQSFSILVSEFILNPPAVELLGSTILSLIAEHRPSLDETGFVTLLTASQVTAGAVDKTGTL